MRALVISPAPRDPRAQGLGVPVVNGLRAPRGLVAAPLFIGRAPYDPVTRRQYATGINPGSGAFPPGYFGEPTRYGFGGRSFYSYWTFTGIGTSTPTKLVQQVAILTGTSVGSVSLSSRGVSLGINGSAKAYVNLYDGTSKTATGTTTLAANTFYVLTGTWDGSTIRIYLNGVLEASTAAGNPWGGTGTTLRLCDQSGPADGTSGSRLFGAILTDNMLWSEGEIYARAREPWAHLDWPADQLARDVGKASTSSAITGSGAITFAAMTAAGTGVEEFSGSGAITFGAMTAAGTGELGLTGSGAITFASMAASGSGALSFVGNGAITFGAMTTTGSGLLGIAGAGALTFAPMTASGSGAVGLSGSGALTFAPMATSGTGYLPITGSGAPTFGPMTIAGVGSVSTTLITGSGSFTFDAMSISGVGLNSAPGPTPVPAPARRRSALSAIPLPTTPWVVPLTGNLTPVAYQFLFTLMRRTGGQPGKTTPDDQDALPLASLLEGADAAWQSISQRFEFSETTQTQTLISLAETERLDAGGVQVVLGDVAQEIAPQLIVLDASAGEDALVPLPIATPQSAPLPDVLTSGASPWTFDAPGKGFVLVEGGTVSAITISRDGTTNYATGMTGGFFPVDWQDQLTITYTVAPNVTFFGSSYDA